MATGHYIQRKMGAAGPELHMAADAARDQSYFLFSTTPEQLAYLRFPLGHLRPRPKPGRWRREIRPARGRQARQPGHLLCPNGNYAAVIEKLRPGAADPGEIVDLDGNVLGDSIAA
jgi:tRNA-uridine 2-sulfurtransferase